jgi:hypothetical protein
MMHRTDTPNVKLLLLQTLSEFVLCTLFFNISYTLFTDDISFIPVPLSFLSKFYSRLELHVFLSRVLSNTAMKLNK